jgi:hypothetical protein
MSDVVAEDRLARREMRVGVVRKGTLILSVELPPGTDVVLGSDSIATVIVSDWTGSSLTLVRAGRWLELGPGMNVHACHDQGEDRLVGSFEELHDLGLSSPIYMNVSRYNIHVADDLSVLIEFKRTSGG